MALPFFSIGEPEIIRAPKLNLLEARVVVVEAGGGGGGGAGVASFNSRTGVVTLTSGDVTGALTYTPLRPSNNLSDLANAASARTNLGLGSAALLASSAVLLTANNLSDLASAATARTNLGLGSAATAATGDFAAVTHTHAYTDVLSVPTGSILYRKTAGTGAAEFQTLATLKADLALAAVATSGSASDLGTGTLPAGRMPAHTGDVTTSAGSVATTIAAGAVTYAKIQNVSATDKLLGRSTAGAGSIEEIACTAAGRALIDDADAAAQRTTLGLGSAATSASSAFAASGAVTGSGLTMTSARLLGRTTAATGAIEELTASAAKSFLAIAAGDVSGLAAVATSGSATDLGAGTLAAGRLPAFSGGDVTSSAGSAVLSVGANRITRAMLAATSGATLLGATAAGNVADLTAAQAKTFLAVTASDVSGLAAIATSGSGADLTAATVTLAKLADVATGTVFYRKTAGSGAPEVQTLATLKTDLALNNVDNTSDANKPISTATQTALNLKANLSDLSYTALAKTNGYTETATSGEKIAFCNLFGGFTVVLPAALSNSARLTFKNLRADGPVTIQAAGTDTIDGNASIILSSQYGSVTLISDGVSAWGII